MKRSGPLKRHKPLRTNIPIRFAGKSETAELKDRIQYLVREIVIARDSGCIARNEPWHTCSGFAKDGHLILQADHLITRANSATYADTRLIVCICKALHGWKKWNEAEYKTRIRPLIGQERCKLWDACHADRYKPTRTGAHDWRLHIAALARAGIEDVAIDP